MLLIVSYIVNRLPCPFIFSRCAKIQNLLILNPQIQASPAPRFAGALSIAGDREGKCPFGWSLPSLFEEWRGDRTQCRSGEVCIGLLPSNNHANSILQHYWQFVGNKLVNVSCWFLNLRQMALKGQPH